jgi:hypothetical protein
VQFSRNAMSALLINHVIILAPALPLAGTMNCHCVDIFLFG